MYDQSMRTGPSYRRRASRVNRKTADRSGGSGSRRKEQVLLTQLVICLVLFVTVFVGKGVLPGRLAQLRSDVLTMISEDFDFRAALAELGASLAGGDSVLSNVGEFCIEVFGTEEADDSVQPAAFQPPEPAVQFRR